MRCPLCGHQVAERQKFCDECGGSLHGVTDPTERLEADPAGARAVPDTAAPGLTPPTDHEPGLPRLGELPTREVTPISPTDGQFEVSAETPLVAGGADLPTQEITPREVIPDPDWATPSDELPVVPPTPPAPTDGTAGLFDDVTVSADGVDPGATTQLAPPEPLPDIDATTTFGAPTAFDPVTDEFAATHPGRSTDEFPPEVFDGSADVYDYPPPREPFRVKLVFILAFFGAVAVLMASVADVVDIRTSMPVPGIDTGIRTMDSLGTNLAVAGFFGASIMTLGGLLACFGFRWGAGLAGGSGLALVGWSAMVVGLAEEHVAQAELRTRQTVDLAFTLKVTRDLGFGLVVAVGAIGLLVFLASLRSFGTGGRAALNPWIAAMGAVAGVVLVTGPLIPEGNANFRNNFRSAPDLDTSTAYFAGRSIHLALIAFAVVFGLLIVRTYGLGFAAGGVTVALWLWLSSLLEEGDFPLGVGIGNFGATDTKPHAVTTVGMVLTVLLLVVGAIMAVVADRRSTRY